MSITACSTTEQKNNKTFRSNLRVLRVSCTKLVANWRRLVGTSMCYLRVGLQLDWVEITDRNYRFEQNLKILFELIRWKPKTTFMDQDTNKINRSIMTRMSRKNAGYFDILECRGKHFNWMQTIHNQLKKRSTVDAQIFDEPFFWKTTFLRYPLSNFKILQYACGSDRSEWKRWKSNTCFWFSGQFVRQRQCFVPTRGSLTDHG